MRKISRRTMSEKMKDSSTFTPIQHTKRIPVGPVMFTTRLGCNTHMRFTVWALITGAFIATRPPSMGRSMGHRESTGNMTPIGETGDLWICHCSRQGVFGILTQVATYFDCVLQIWKERKKRKERKENPRENRPLPFLPFFLSIQDDTKRSVIRDR